MSPLLAADAPCAWPPPRVPHGHGPLASRPQGADLKQARAPLGEAAVATHQPAAAARHHKDGAAQAGQQHAEQQRFDRVVYSGEGCAWG